MRAVRALTGFSAASSEQPWLPGVLPVAAALATCPLFGGQACLTGLLLATLASFVVYLPLTALALNGGGPISADAEAPLLTPRARLVLLALWTATAWIGAALSSGMLVR